MRGGIFGYLIAGIWGLGYRGRIVIFRIIEEAIIREFFVMEDKSYEVIDLELKGLKGFRWKFRR